MVLVITWYLAQVDCRCFSCIDCSEIAPWGHERNPTWMVNKMNPEDKPPTIVYVKRNIIAAIVSVGLIAPILWMLMDRQPPFTDHVGRIIPDDPAPGDFVFV